MNRRTDEQGFIKEEEEAKQPAAISKDPNRGYHS
jgi:hypothetical protein